MYWWQSVDLYCERLSAEFGAEPINTATNAIYILVGIIGIAKSLSNTKDWVLYFLSMLVFFIGIGSTLFHFFAVHWTRLSDLVPIWIFVVAYMYFSFRRMLCFSSVVSALALALVVCLIYAFIIALPVSAYRWSNGSIEYVPALIAASALAVYLHLQSDQRARVFIAGTIFIWVAVFFRSADLETCSIFAMGTHFFWHIFSGIAMGCFLAAIRLQDNRSILGV